MPLKILSHVVEFTHYISNHITFSYKSSAVAEMGDRGHNRHGPKRGGCCAPFAERWEPV